MNVNTSQQAYVKPVPKSVATELKARVYSFSDCSTRADFFVVASDLIQWAKKQRHHQIKILAAAEVEQAMNAMRNEDAAMPFISTLVDIERAAHNLFLHSLQRLSFASTYRACALALTITQVGMIGRDALTMKHKADHSGEQKIHLPSKERTAELVVANQHDIHDMASRERVYTRDIAPWKFPLLWR